MNRHRGLVSAAIAVLTVLVAACSPARQPVAEGRRTDGLSRARRHTGRRPRQQAN